MIHKIYGVLGLGIFGQTIAKELSTFEQDVIALDNHESNVQDVAEFVSKAAVGDITDIEFLRAAGIEHCDTVIIATGEHLEASVLALIHCKKLGVPNIIAKAVNENYEEVLYGIGANQVTMPERSTGKRLASILLRNKISNVFHIEDDISVIEFDIPKDWVGKTLVELDLRKKYDLNIIGIRKAPASDLDINFQPTDSLPDNISISAVANSRTFEKFDYLGYLK